MRWEYMVAWIVFNHADVFEQMLAVQTLNALGEQGWELVAVEASVYTFKRPKSVKVVN